MFNATFIVIEAFIRELRTMYERTYGTMEPGYPGVISFVAQLALENIATSDAAYHDVDHTIMVTLVGQEILRGRHISVGGVTPLTNYYTDAFPCRHQCGTQNLLHVLSS